MIQSGVDATLSCRPLAESERLVVSLIHDSLAIEKSEEAVLTGAKCRINSWCTALRASIVIVVSTTGKQLQM